MRNISSVQSIITSLMLLVFSYYLPGVSDLAD